MPSCASQVIALVAIVSVIWSPRKPTFNVTSKSDFASEDHVSELMLPYVAIFALLAFGSLFGFVGLLDKLGPRRPAPSRGPRAAWAQWRQSSPVAMPATAPLS